MVPRGIRIPLCVVALVCLSASASGVSIYFDIDGDALPDTNCTIGPGDALVVGVCLSDFAEEAGSFQFDLYYDDAVLELIDYDTFMGQPDEDPGLTGTIQTLAELGPWATSQWSSPVTQEFNEPGGGGGGARLEFYTAGSFTQTASGDGVLAWLVFRPVGAGQTDLQLAMPGATWFLEDVTVQPTPIDLTVTVIPEPSVLVLVAGVALASLRRHRRRP